MWPFNDALAMMVMQGGPVRGAFYAPKDQKEAVDAKALRGRVNAELQEQAIRGGMNKNWQNPYG